MLSTWQSDVLHFRRTGRFMKINTIIRLSICDLNQNIREPTHLGKRGGWGTTCIPHPVQFPDLSTVGSSTPRNSTPTWICTPSKQQIFSKISCNCRIPENKVLGYIIT